MLGFDQSLGDARPDPGERLAALAAGVGRREVGAGRARPAGAAARGAGLEAAASAGGRSRAASRPARPAC